MDLRFRLYMLFPFLLFMAAFLFDKVFFIGDFPDYFLRTASFLNYDHKEVLREELKNYLSKKDRKKTLVIFGNSRTMSFDNTYFEKKYPDWILFNFSVPGGTSDLYAYHMEKFKEEGISPDYILFAVTPQGFNLVPSIAMDEVILNGLSFTFILKHFDRYTLDELTNYLAKKTFWSYRNRPRPAEISRRIKNDSQFAKTYHLFVERTRDQLIRERGSVPYNIDSTVRHEDENFLVEDARNTFRTFFNPFKLSQGQVDFTDDCVKIANQIGSRSALLWAKVGPELRRLINEEPVIDYSRKKTVREIWEPSMQRISQKYNVDIIDMNFEKTIACDMFYDASHMAGYCFHDFTDFLIRNIENDLIQNDSKQ